MTNQQKYMRSAVVAFLALATAFFFIRGWFVAVPTLFAAIITAANRSNCGYAIPLALLFSAAGDYAGSVGNFLVQVAMFALAHICYICDFAPHRELFKAKKGVGALALFTIVYLIFVLSHISSKAEFVAVTIYALIIFTMGATAIIQRRKYYAWYVVAALLFIFSDSLIVFDKYIATIPARTIWVMTTYYAAQAIFMTLALSRENPKE